jgi:hypothetical protein
MTAEESLTTLLQSLFDVGGLRRFLRSDERTQPVVDHIPGEPAPLADVAFETTLELMRRGVADGAFFARLMLKFPAKRAQVEEVMRHLGVEAPPGMGAGKLDARQPPRRLSFAPSGKPDRQVVEAFAELYPSPLQARALWQRAGGRIGDVPHAERPRDMWFDLWRQSLLGGPARPERLLQEALEDAPENAVLREALAGLTV